MPIKRPTYLTSRHIHPRVRIDTAQLPDGHIIEPVILEFSDWVGIIALTQAQQVLLIRLYRRGVDQIVWEIPGGMIDPGETPLEAAKRELLEETGYGGGTFIELPVISPNSDNHTNRYHPFLALDVEKRSGLSEEDIDRIEVHPTPLAEVIRMAQNGELLQAMQVSALFFALSHLKRIVP
jgi:8-oxo-dGTP pyrophosphatase MutT (NUDIX family)